MEKKFKKVPHSPTRNIFRSVVRTNLETHVPGGKVFLFIYLEVG